MLADEGRSPALGSHRRRSGRDSNPRGRLTPPTRFPVALLQPLGHHSRSASQHRAGVPAGSPLCRFSRSERLFAATVACAARGRSRSFLLAPGASRSRLKLRRGTEAFRGNGTPAEWTKRRASGHSFFGRRAGCGDGAPRPWRFSRCERHFALRAACAGGVRAPTVPLAPDAELEADEAPPGCWKSLGTKARRRGLRSDRIAFGAFRFPRAASGERS
jgi:hypothetical protein